MYEYRATVQHVVDGDTIDFDVDLGFHVHQYMRVRLEGIDAPEKGTSGGSAATEFVQATLPVGAEVVLLTTRDKQEKYGRYLARVYLVDGTTLQQRMITLGLAREYSGGAR